MFSAVKAAALQYLLRAYQTKKELKSPCIDLFSVHTIEINLHVLCTSLKIAAGVVVLNQLCAKV